MPTPPPRPITLTLRDGPPVMAVERLSIGTAVLRLADTLPTGRWLYADLQHPTFGAVATAAHVAWTQQIAPGLSLTLAGVEFVGTWEKLGALRRAILGVMASDALAGGLPIGWIAPEPDGTWTCFARDSMKVAMISQDGKGFSVRRRDATDPAGVVIPSSTFVESVVLAFDRSPTETITLEPPVGPRSGAHPRPASKTPASSPPRPAVPVPPVKRLEEKKKKKQQQPTPISESAEDVILAAQTIMVDGDAGAPPHDDEEDQLLAARTLRLDDDDGPPESEESVLGAQTVVLPNDRVTPKGEGKGPDRRWSKVHDGATLVGWIAPDTPTAWTIYDEKRHKIAVAAVEAGSVRVCWLGDKSTESFEYFEAPTVGEAMAAAFELASPPKIDPPL